MSEMTDRIKLWRSEPPGEETEDDVISLLCDAEEDLIGLERFRKLRLRHNDEMSRTQSALAQARKELEVLASRLAVRSGEVSVAQAEAERFKAICCELCGLKDYETDCGEEPTCALKETTRE